VTFLLDTAAISDLMRSGIQQWKSWMVGLSSEDRVVTCTIARGEVLFGIARLAEGKRRAELEETAANSSQPFTANPFRSGGLLRDGEACPPSARPSIGRK